MAKILVVDDNEIFIEQIRVTLEGAGHEVLKANDGINGLEVLRANLEVELILLDVNMPNMDGLTMSKEIHKDDKINKIPIFMLTTESNPEMKKMGKELGVRAWVRKPYEEKKLLTAIGMVTGKKTGAICKIPMKIIEKHGDKIPFDVFLKLSETKMVKISHKEGSIKDLVAKYSKKGENLK